MSFTNQTTHYGLPQWIGTDKPTYLIDQNNAYQKIDTEIYNANATASEAMTSADSATGKVNGAIETANNALDVANGAVTTANQATTIANNANTVAGGAVTTANDAEVTAQKALDSIVDITGWKYSANCVTLNSSVPTVQPDSVGVYNTALKMLNVSYRTSLQITSNTTTTAVTINAQKYYLLFKLNITSTSQNYAMKVAGHLQINNIVEASQAVGSVTQAYIVLYDGVYYLANKNTGTLAIAYQTIAIFANVIFNDDNINLSTFTDVPAPPTT